jgi:hypothetical protein
MALKNKREKLKTGEISKNKKKENTPRAYTHSVSSPTHSLTHTHTPSGINELNK